MTNRLLVVATVLMFCAVALPFLFFLKGEEIVFFLIFSAFFTMLLLK